MDSIQQPEYSAKDFASPVTDTFLRAFATGSVLIDCPRITVRQLAEKKPQVFNGRGMLSLLAGEEFQLRMYVNDDCIDQHHPIEEFLRMAQCVSGEVIPPEEYFELSATDISGFEWSCGKIQAKIHGGCHGIVITGRLIDVLRHRMSGLTATLPSLMSMFFFDNLQIPFNQFVLTQSTSGERTLSSKILPEFARFDAGDFHFEIQKAEPEKGSTILRVSSSIQSLPDGIETRVEESLRYLTLNPIHWCIVDKRVGDTREVAIVPRRVAQSPIFDEPLDHSRQDCAVDFWRLFVAYFQHVVSHPEPQNYHPLSAQLFHVISAETRQLDLLGLLVSVAVEGVLNCEFADLAKPSDVFKTSLDQIGKSIRRLRCADAKLAARLQGVLTPMKSSRPKDKLKVLEDTGVITKDMVKKWEKLRNTTAHAAVRVDPAETQAMLTQCYIVYTMLNRLIFQAIGYSGKYQDFSTLGWPIEEFKAPSVSVA